MSEFLKFTETLQINIIKYLDKSNTLQMIEEKVKQCRVKRYDANRFVVPVDVILLAEISGSLVV